MTSGLLAMALIGYASGLFTIKWNGNSPPSPGPATPTLAVATSTTSPTENCRPRRPLPRHWNLPRCPLAPAAPDSIAFTANNDIYLIDSNGGNIRQLTNTNRVKFDLSFSQMEMSCYMVKTTASTRWM